MIYLAIAIGQTIDPSRVALVVLCSALVWKITTSAAQRLSAAMGTLTVLAVLMSIYIRTAHSINSGLSELAMVSLAGLAANIFIAAPIVGCAKLFRVAYRQMSQW